MILGKGIYPVSYRPAAEQPIGHLKRMRLKCQMVWRSPRPSDEEPPTGGEQFRGLRILVVALLFAATAGAQQYSFRVYGNDQGLTNLAVKGLHQDKQGFLWVSTEGGVFRYDGERFQSFGEKNGIPPSSGVAFGQAPDGSLLAGGQIGLFQKAGERFEAISMPGAKSVSWFSGIQSDGKGATWIATDAGLMGMTRDPGTSAFVFRLIPKPGGVDKPNAYGLLVEGDAVWYGCDKELCRFDGRQTEVFGVAAGLPASQWKGIQRAGNGDLWAQGRNEVARLRRGGSRFEVVESPFRERGATGILSVDSAGRVIVGTNDGLVIREGDSWQSIGRDSGLRGSVYTSLQDREGSLWIGLLGRGLVRWVGYREWEAFTSDSGLGSDIVYETLPLPDGTVWAATEAGLFHGAKVNDVWTWRRQLQLGRISIHSIRPDKAGRLWLGTESKGAARFNPVTEQIEWFNEKQGLNGKNPYTVTLDSRNRIWAVTERGLFVADLGTLRFRRVEQVPEIQTWAVIEAANGDIWVGSAKGLFRLSGSGWTHITESDGLSHEVVLSLAGAKDGDVWVGYRFGGGIDRIQMKGGVPVISRPANNPGGNSIVYFLGFDARDWLWAGTDRGLDVWDGSVWSRYDRRDGLVWDDCDLNGFAAGPDGSVWIGTSGGLARFTPPKVAARIYNPDVIYTRINLGNKEVDAATQPSADHASNTLNLRFSALTFSRESSVVFRYRMPPLFDAWHETQQHELQFDGLAPGKYRLELMARDGWGRWSAKPTAFSFEIRAPWWRAAWILPFLLTVPLALLALFSRLRGIAMRRRERNLMRLVDDRTADLKDANKQLLRLADIEHEKDLSEKQRAHAEDVARLNRRAIETLALAIEAKDETTADHLRRVEVYAIEVAKEMGLGDLELDALRAAALLHDVGKLAVPEYIISKPGRLTPGEFEKMKTHTVIGAEIVEQIGFPYPVAPIVRARHEKWDGRGYPDGLSGERIPIGARILAAVDCLDALASDRQYRRALPLDEAIKVIQAEAGKSFDPAVAEILARRYLELESLARTSCAIEKTRLSTNLKIVRGQSPASGFEATASSILATSDLVNLHKSIVREEHEERALADLKRSLADCVGSEEIFAVLRESLRNRVPYDVMALYRCRGDRLIPESLDGEGYRLFASLEIPLGTGLSGWVAENRKPIINGNPAVEPGYLNDPAKFGILHSALSVPLESQGQVAGVLSLYSMGRDAFSPEHLARVVLLSEPLACGLVAYEEAVGS
jgi:putative nucleotidyltransferase with HDIG domain